MQGPLRVVPARLRHVPALSRLLRDSRRRRAGTAAGTDGAGALLWAARWSPSLGLLQSVWPAPVPGMPGPRSFVAEQDGRPVGLAQMAPRQDPQQWDVVYLALEQEPPKQPDTLPPLRLVPDRRATRLLGELCDAGVLLSATRLFGRVDEDDECYEMFRQVGFTPVVREFSYFRPLGRDDGREPEPEIPGLRLQRPADAFGLHQLYQASNPRLVQLAEDKRSRSWERQARAPRARRWVVERDARQAAWLQLALQRRGPHPMQLMVDDRDPDLLQPLIRFALRQAGARPAQGVLVRVREHQRRIVRALEEQGFEPLGAQVLMVKQLAVPVMQPQLGRVLEKVV